MPIEIACNWQIISLPNPGRETSCLSMLDVGSCVAGCRECQGFHDWRFDYMWGKRLLGVNVALWCMHRKLDVWPRNHFNSLHHQSSLSRCGLAWCIASLCILSAKKTLIVLAGQSNKAKRWDLTFAPTWGRPLLPCASTRVSPLAGL